MLVVKFESLGEEVLVVEFGRGDVGGRVGECEMVLLDL